MLLHFIVRVVLMVLALLLVVPAATGGSVAIRKGGFLRGLLALFVLGLVNSGLWFVFALVTAGGALVANALTFGVIGILINALAFVGTSKIMPETLRVDGYGSAVWASVVMTVASFLIHMLV